MAPLVDAQKLKCYRDALANHEYAGFIVFEPIARQWIRVNLTDLTTKDVAALMHKYVARGGKVDQQRETRPEWKAHEFHYDLRIPIGDRLVYCETRLIVDDPDDPDGSIVHVVNVHDA